MRDTFARTLYEIACKDSRIFIVVADISPAGSMAKFRQEYPERFINVGVAEQSMIGLCAGLALRGCRPFAYTIATFTIYRPFEQVRDDLCYQNVPATLVGIGGGVTYSTLGGTHHAQEDIALMGAIPNMAILAPCDPTEAVAATWACVERNGPTYLRLGKTGEPDLSAAATGPFVFGKIRTLRPGRDVCILSYGPIMKMAFEVADQLEAGGRSTAVVSVHTLKPLDRDGLKGVLGNYGQVIVIEEHSEIGGLAAQVKQLAWECKATCDLRTFSLKDEFIHSFGAHADLLAAHGLSASRILESVSGRPPARH
jgi:transketolase